MLTNGRLPYINTHTHGEDDVNQAFVLHRRGSIFPLYVRTSETINYNRE